jgi:hypothetical protein
MILLFKSYVRSHTRRLKSGKLVQVGAYSNKVTATEKFSASNGKSNADDRQMAFDFSLEPDGINKDKSNIAPNNHSPDQKMIARDLFSHPNKKIQDDDVNIKNNDGTNDRRNAVTPEMPIPKDSGPAGERNSSIVLSDDPDSPNYRYRDTGHISGSRKEMAAQMLKRSAKEGRQVLVNDIDWEEIERNPREAKELIVKSALFGQVPWDRLKDAGMEPGAAFLIDRVYASIAIEPIEDSPQARKDYALGLQTLRDRLERCKTPADVTDTLNELREEYDGTMLNADESVAYQEYMAARIAILEGVKSVRTKVDAMYSEASQLQAEAYKLQRESDSRKRRGWKASPELDQRLAESESVAGKALDEWRKKLEEVKPEISAAEYIAEQYYQKAKGVQSSARDRNEAENPLRRAWGTFGDRFVGVLKYRSSGFYFRGQKVAGSKAFQGHIAAVKAGRVKDWSWAETTGATRAPKATESEARFQMKVAERFARKGGRSIDAASTDLLKRAFNLRDVQSGNWVLKDPASAKFHVENCAAAFSDLADIVGITDEKVSLNGRLAMAFGARGAGSAGFRGGAARAHYEPVQRVINLTKMGGGGSLAHEWAHAMDNLIKSMVAGGEGSADDFPSENPDILPEGRLKAAYISLRSAMLDGTEKAKQVIKYTDKDLAVAIYNIDRPKPSPIASAIKSAKDAQEAVDSVERYFMNRLQTPKIKKQINLWRQVAAAYHDRNPAGGVVKVKAGQIMSAFAASAVDLDGSKPAYYSQPREMFARAFQSYVEDRLSEAGRQNDYLSAMADNKFYFDHLLGVQWKPFPEGEERKRINLAFDELFDVVRKDDIFSKAISMMDAREKSSRIFILKSHAHEQLLRKHESI